MRRRNAPNNPATRSTAELTKAGIAKDQKRAAADKEKTGKAGKENGKKKKKTGRLDVQMRYTKGHVRNELKARPHGA